jgi:hypothetical protein
MVPEQGERTNYSARAAATKAWLCPASREDLRFSTRDDESAEPALSFLGPALVALVIIHRGQLRTGPTLARWGGGMLLGLLPYGAGYFSWWRAVGGSRAFVQSVASMVEGLQDFRSQSVLERIGRVVHLADLAWTNRGSDRLMFGDAPSALRPDRASQ